MDLITRNLPTTSEYLTELLTAYWFAPPVALWRAVEVRMAAQEEYVAPLLDLGCGDGLVMWALFGAEGQVDVGLDPWEEQLRRAAQSGAYRHVDLAYGHCLPYANAAFATVFSNSVLEHIPDLLPVLREVRRVLMPGGHFIFTVPSDAFRYLLDGYIQRMEKGDISGAEAYASAVDAQLEHHHYYMPTDWRHLLGAARMSMVKARYYMPREAMRLWDQMNVRYGIGRRWTMWSLLVSPRLRLLGYQALLRTIVVRTLSRRWRPYYEMVVPDGEKGGGLLIVARREG